MDGILNTAYLISQSNILSIVHMACNQLTYYLLIFKEVDEMIAYVFDMAKRTRHMFISFYTQIYLQPMLSSACTIRGVSLLVSSFTRLILSVIACCKTLNSIAITMR